MTNNMVRMLRTVKDGHGLIRELLHRNQSKMILEAVNAGHLTYSKTSFAMEITDSGRAVVKASSLLKAIQ